MATPVRRRPLGLRGVSVLAGLLLAGPAAGAEPGVRLLESDSRHVVLEIVPAAPSVERVVTSEREYVRLHVAGYGLRDEVGRPEVPVGSFRVALPAGAVPRLRVIQSSWSELRAGAIVPVAERVGVRETFGTSRVVEREPVEGRAYLSMPTYPANPFELSHVATLRHQRVVSVIVHAVRAEVFARGHRVLEKAVLEVVFESGGWRAGERVTRPASPDELWEKTYRGAVLNWEAARGWKRAGPADGPSVGNAPWGGGDQWKVRVPGAGIMAISYEALAAAGFPAGVASGQISVYQRRFDLDHVDDPATAAAALFSVLPVPVVVRDADGTFGPGDRLLFYGRSFRDQWMTSGAEYEDRFGQDNHVWVRLAAGGARMDTIRVGGSLSGAPGDTLAATPASVFREQDSWYYEHPPDHVDGSEGFESEFYYRNSARTTASIDTVGGVPETDPSWWFTDFFWVDDPAADSAATLVARIAPGGKRTHANHTNVLRFSVSDSLVGERTFYNSSLYVGEYCPPANCLSSYSVPGELLSHGSNAFRFKGYSYLGSGTSTVYWSTRFFFDWYRIDYDRQLRARDGVLRVSTEKGTSGNQIVRVVGFTGGDLLLFEVTDPGKPRVVGLNPAAQVVPDGGGYALVFDHDNAAGSAVYRAVQETAIASIAAESVSRVGQSTLLAAGVGVRYVALAHADFLQGARELATYRAGDGTALAVPVSEVYDVFGNGLPSDLAIKSYTAYAFHRWVEPLAFLCLVGDASEDHRGIEGASNPDFVPSHSLYAPYEGAPEESDQYYAEVTRGGTGSPGDPFDDLADIYVGRLAVGSTDEFAWNLNRIRSYEAQVEEASWKRRVLFLADDCFSGDLGATPGSGYEWNCFSERGFQTVSDSLAVLLESYPYEEFLVDRVYLSEWTHPCPDYCYEKENPDSVDCEAGTNWDCGYWYDCYDPNWANTYQCVRTVVREGFYPVLRGKLQRGGLIWNYQGHANKYFLAHEEIFKDYYFGDVRDVNGMTNQGRPFIFLGFACHLAEFDCYDEDSREDCLSEKMMNRRSLGVNRPAGAVAAFASSGFEFLGPNLAFNRHVIRCFFLPDSTTAGIPGAPVVEGIYAWTLGETTTRARLLYQSNYPYGNQRQAAQRFVLLGDPGLRPDTGPPEMTVTVNGQEVSDGEYLDLPEEPGGVLEIVADTGYGRGIQSFRIFDDGSEVPATDYTVAVTDTSADGVQRGLQASYDHTVRGADYDLLLEAVGWNGARNDFTLRVRTTMEVIDLTAYPTPFADDVGIYYRLATRGQSVRVRVYSVAGRKVWEQGSAPNSPDVNALWWDGRDARGRLVANGTYLVHVLAVGRSGSAEATTTAVKLR